MVQLNRNEIQQLISRLESLKQDLDNECNHLMGVLTNSGYWNDDKRSDVARGVNDTVTSIRNAGGTLNDAIGYLHERLSYLG